MRMYRESGRQQRVLANVAIDLGNRPESASLAEVVHVSLIVSPEEARQRLKRIERQGSARIPRRRAQGYRTGARLPLVQCCVRR
jgi:hypothetical protein